jgi:o-succinylbenzoate synthase
VNLLAVERAELVAIGGPLPATAGNARVEWRERRGVALRLDAHGLVGWGECSPLPGLSPDRLDEDIAGLGRLLGAELPRLDLDDPFRAITAWVERLPEALPAARFALDTALLDLCAQAYGCPVATLIGEGRAPVAASTLVSLDDWPDEVPLAIARRLMTVKIKVGRPGKLEAELSTLAALRQAHPTVTLRLDANGMYGTRDVGHALAALAALGPEWIEQPVPPGLLASLPPPPCPIAADESAGADDDDLWRAVHKGIVSILVIKPALVGGLVRAASMAERARGLGLDAVISHIMDGPIALAGAAGLGVGFGGRRAAGLGPHAGLAAYPAVPVPQLAGGVLVSSGPGLGVALE